MSPVENLRGGGDIRANAARAVMQVAVNNRTIDWVEREKPAWMNQPLTRALCYGTIRHFFSLSAQVNACLNKPLRGKDQDLYALMLVGAYQLRHTDTPPHAAINETVEAVLVLRKPWARGLLNAVLRRLSEEPAITDQTFDHPEWMVRMIRAQYPDQWVDILRTNNERAPMCLRVNAARCSRDEYTRRLVEADIASHPGAAASAIVLEQAQPSATLPGWQDGLVAVQDMGAQFAAGLLPGSRSGPDRILDACAAPGGKLAHLYESRADQAVTITAVEISARRIEQTRAILARLGHPVAMLCGDATQADWWDRIPFTHILLDAPCSGTGTLRRHPDIKLLASPESVAAHAAGQLRLLNNLWQMLTPGGTLLYCTCSILAEENDQVIEQFIQQHQQDLNLQTITLPSGTATRYGWQLLPTDAETDGFYYACLHKG